MLAALVLVGVCVLAADTPPSGAGRTADDAVESASRWTLRYTGQGDLRMISTTGGGASLFTMEGRRSGWSMLRWDGASWRRTGLPGPFGKARRLDVTSSPTGKTIWAAAAVHGAYDNVTEQLWQWSDGRWTRHLSRSAEWNPAVGIAVDSHDDVWLVTGMDPDGGSSKVLHRSGKTWRDDTPPVRSLARVAAARPDDVWVVTDQQMSNEVATTLHWNGANWKKIDHPCMVDAAPGSCRGRSYLGQLSLTAQSDGQAWAVGPFWADGGSPVVLHWDRTQWKQVSLNVVRTGLTAVRTDPVSGLWIAANPTAGAPYVLNLRGGRWTKSTLPVGGPADRIVNIAPVPGTTRLWVQTERRDPAGHEAGDKVASLVYELS
ncbi:hypothetical protein OG339_39035 [Streptosporangium sp. NBC_01495]|uniref:hypothetical protein n=1 Tax=Streptosporangium sp. NBC_01495 TaxID=2903899 RepID=UPI002E377920|nr:hypothetical protein [Streptosporangium sp. NBC_01495]